MPLPVPGDFTQYSVVTAMITPAFFLTATSSLLATSNTRLARIVDRMRQVLGELRESADQARRQELIERIVQHRRRSSLVLASLRLLYAAVSAFVGTSLGIAVDLFFKQYPVHFVPTLLAVIGVLLMLAASICLGVEARISLRMLDVEFDRELAQHPADKPR